MTNVSQSAQISCFGKLASRGDFIRTTANPALLATLDRWASQAMELLVSEARWKQLYDAAPPLDFALVGTRSRIVIAGHLRVSQDASQRRFPFMAAVPLEVAQPMEFLPRSPLALSRVWQRLDLVVNELMTTSDPADLLPGINSDLLAVDVSAASYNALFADFTATQSIGALEEMLHAAGHQTRLQHVLLALGLLLQPVMSSGMSHLDKGLRLPLPRDPMSSMLVASFWLELITRFLARADFELALFIDAQAERPCLVAGFNGASPESLHSMFDPQVDAERNILLDDPEWVIEQSRADYGIAKLNSYVAQPQLTLKSALATFMEVFMGA